MFQSKFSIIFWLSWRVLISWVCILSFRLIHLKEERQGMVYLLFCIAVVQNIPTSLRNSIISKTHLDEHWVLKYYMTYKWVEQKGTKVQSSIFWYSKNMPHSIDKKKNVWNYFYIQSSSGCSPVRALSGEKVIRLPPKEMCLACSRRLLSTGVNGLLQFRSV